MSERTRQGVTSGALVLAVGIGLVVWLAGQIPAIPIAPAPTARPIPFEASVVQKLKDATIYGDLPVTVSDDQLGRDDPFVR